MVRLKLVYVLVGGLEVVMKLIYVLMLGLEGVFVEALVVRQVLMLVVKLKVKMMEKLH